jgi:hypothetical protein
MVDLSIVMLVYQSVLWILAVSENADVFFQILCPDPNTFLGSVWGMIWGVMYLLRRCLDP